MTNLENIAATLRSSGMNPGQRATVLDLIRAAVEQETRIGAEHQTNETRPDAARSVFMAVSAARRMGISVDPEKGIDAVAFDVAARGRSIEERFAVKSGLHFAGLLNQPADC